MIKMDRSTGQRRVKQFCLILSREATLAAKVLHVWNFNPFGRGCSLWKNLFQEESLFCKHVPHFPIWEQSLFCEHVLLYKRKVYAFKDGVISLESFPLYDHLM